jgi:hypothetical protein
MLDDHVPRISALSARRKREDRTASPDMNAWGINARHGAAALSCRAHLSD